MDFLSAAPDAGEGAVPRQHRCVLNRTARSAERFRLNESLYRNWRSGFGRTTSDIVQVSAKRPANGTQKIWKLETTITQRAGHQKELKRIHTKNDK